MGPGSTHTCNTKGQAVLFQAQLDVSGGTGIYQDTGPDGVRREPGHWVRTNASHSNV